MYISLNHGPEFIQEAQLSINLILNEKIIEKIFLKNLLKQKQKNKDEI